MSLSDRLHRRFQIDAEYDAVTDHGRYCGACDGGPGPHRPAAHPPLSPFARMAREGRLRPAAISGEPRL